MATQRSTVEHIVEAAAGAGVVRTRAMFGEYALYCDDKVVALICDDTLFLKDTPGARGLIDTPDLGAPYPGARPHIVADVLLDGPDALARALRAVCDDLPAPKPKKPRKR